jgi:hypothetical protein
MIVSNGFGRTYEAEWVYWPYGRPPEFVPLPYYPTTTGGTAITITGRIEPEVIEQGWQCPACKKVYAPHVESCHCRVKEWSGG